MVLQLRARDARGEGPPEGARASRGSSTAPDAVRTGRTACPEVACFPTERTGAPLVSNRPSGTQQHRHLHGSQDSASARSRI